MRARMLQPMPWLLALGLFLPGAGARSSTLDEKVYGPFPVRFASTQRPDSLEISEAERVAREVVRTDRLLGEVDARVGRTKNAKAQADLDSARTRQGESKAALNTSLFARAMRLTLEARALGKSALIKVGPANQDPDFVSRALDQTDDALHRADDLLDDGAAQDARRRFEALKGQQKGAHEAFRDGNYPSAYATTRKVRDGVLDLLRQIADLPVSEDTARKAIRRAERALSQVDEDLGGHPAAPAQRLEREARDQMQKARWSYARKSYRDALLHAKLVERNLELAIDAERVATSRSE